MMAVRCVRIRNSPLRTDWVPASTRRQQLIVQSVCRSVIRFGGQMVCTATVQAVQWVGRCAGWRLIQWLFSVSTGKCWRARSNGDLKPVIDVDPISTKKARVGLSYSVVRCLRFVFAIRVGCVYVLRHCSARSDPAKPSAGLWLRDSESVWKGEKKAKGDSLCLAFYWMDPSV